jgi:hypothetical protein
MALKPNQHQIQWVTRALPLGHEADHLLKKRRRKNQLDADKLKFY